MEKPVRDKSAPRSEVHLLSIDVDDIGIAWADKNRRPVPSDYRHTVGKDTGKTLALFDRLGCRATFFVNTQLCADEGFVREIAAAGHELASHGHRHFDVRQVSLEDFRADLYRSLEILSRHQPRIVGYRPPSFTMPFREEYFRILGDAGIRYLSSGVGVARSNAPAGDYPMLLPCGLIHVPISTRLLLGGRLRYPIGYGVASRLMPESMYLATLRRWIEDHDFFHYYTHTFEIAGINRDRPMSWRERWEFPSKGIYCIRCQDRETLFERIIRTCHFTTIESGISPILPRPVSAQAGHLV